MEKLRNLLSGRVDVEIRSFNLLREVVLYGMYVNWFISFFDKLSFPYFPNVLGDHQWFLVSATIATLFVMFLTRGDYRIGISVLHAVFLVLAYGLEVQYRTMFSYLELVQPLTLQLGKFHLFSILGFLIWFLIIQAEGMLNSISRIESELDFGVVKLSTRFQLRIPVDARNEFGFKPGDHVMWKGINGRLVIEKIE